MQGLEEKRAHLFMSAECNLNCEYCYIDKNDSLSGIDDEILDEWEERGIFNKLKDNYGKPLEHIGLWGSEPTLYFEYFLEEIPDILDYFENLNDIMVSSNFYAKDSADNLAKLVKIINNHTDRDFSIDIQTSLDGPSKITNKTRPPKEGNGKTVDHIKENLDYMLDKISNYQLRDNFTVNSKFKATVSMRYISNMGEDKEELINYIKFFDQDMWAIYDQYKDDLSDSFHFSVTSGAPTLVVPGEYTAQDGKKLAQYIKNVKEIAIENQKKNNISTHFRVHRAIPGLRSVKMAERRNKSYRLQNRGFSCSMGGKGFALGTGNESHPCHRDFLLSKDDYMELMKETNDEYKMGLLKQYRNNMIVDDKQENEYEYLRQRYVVQGWRDFAQLRFSYNYANLKFMAKIGQARGEYLEKDDMAKLLSKFLLKENLCAVENIENTGSYYLKPMVATKLWANGAFKELIKSRNELVERGIING